MEQNRSYRSEATSDDSDSNTSSSSKKAATPRYQGAAYQPVERPRPSSSFANEALPRVPLEGLIPLRERVTQDLIDKQENDKKEASSSDTDTKTTAKEQAPSVPHPRAPEAPTAAEREQHRMHELLAETDSNKEDEDDEDEEDNDKNIQSKTVAPRLPDQPHQSVPAETAAEPAPSVFSQRQPAAPIPTAPAHLPVATSQEKAFTPPQEGIPTLTVPEEYIPPHAEAGQSAETPPWQQWQSEAAPAFSTAEYTADTSDPNAASNQQPPSPPIKPPTEMAGFGLPPEGPRYGYDPYNPYMHPGAPAAEQHYTPVVSQAAEHTRIIETQNPWIVPTMLGAVLYEGHRRRVWDRREAASRIAGDQELEKRLTKLANLRHQDVLRRQADTTENIYELQSEQHRQAYEQQRLREVQERYGLQPLTYGSERTHAPTAFERTAPTLGPERAPLPTAARADMQPVQKPVAEMSPEEALQQAQEQHERTRKVHSIWHETEVNAITGQEVEGVVHGKGYHEERQQEIMRDRMGDATTDPVAASMGSYAVQSQGVPPYSMQQSALPSGMTTPALPQGTPTHVDPQHQLSSGDNSSMKSNVTNPWFWLMLGLILAAFFTAALI